jgi:hypothetical protein
MSRGLQLLTPALHRRGYAGFAMYGDNLDRSNLRHGTLAARASPADAAGRESATYHHSPYLKRLKESLAAGCELPNGPLALVTPSSDVPVEYEPVRFRGLSSRSVPDGNKVQGELYFPLPYNDEQVTIMSAIDRAHRELVDLDRRVDEIAAAQLADIDVDGVQMRAQRLAQLVVTGSA